MELKSFSQITRVVSTIIWAPSLVAFTCDANGTNLRFRFPINLVDFDISTPYFNWGMTTFCQGISTGYMISIPIALPTVDIEHIAKRNAAIERQDAVKSVQAGNGVTVKESWESYYFISKKS